MDTWVDIFTKVERKVGLFRLFQVARQGGHCHSLQHQIRAPRQWRCRLADDDLETYRVSFQNDLKWNLFSTPSGMKIVDFSMS